MEKFKTGDKVKIINTDNYLDKEFYVPSRMNNLIGQTGVVKFVLDRFDRPTAYNVNGWYWLENMIVSVTNFEPNKSYKVKLVDKYYNTDSFKKLSREQRKCVSSYSNETFIVRTDKDGNIDNFFGNSLGKPDFFEIIENVTDPREKYVGKWINSSMTYPKGNFKCVALSTNSEKFIIVESEDGWSYKYGSESFDRQCDTNKGYWYIDIDYVKIINEPKKIDPREKYIGENVKVSSSGNIYKCVALDAKDDKWIIVESTKGWSVDERTRTYFDRPFDETKKYLFLHLDEIEITKKVDPRDKYIGKWIKDCNGDSGIVVGLSNMYDYNLIIEKEDGWEADYNDFTNYLPIDKSKKYWAINVKDIVYCGDNKPLRKWTIEELQMVDTLIADIMMFSNPFIRTYEMSNKCVKLVNTKGKTFVARCSHEDTPNQKVGLAVALCKMTGTTIPDFIKH